MSGIEMGYHVITMDCSALRCDATYQKRLQGLLLGGAKCPSDPAVAILATTSSHFLNSLTHSLSHTHFPNSAYHEPTQFDSATCKNG